MGQVGDATERAAQFGWATGPTGRHTASPRAQRKYRAAADAGEATQPESDAPAAESLDAYHQDASRETAARLSSEVAGWLSVLGWP
jgi:hypothetical protein